MGGRLEKGNLDAKEPFRSRCQLISINTTSEEWFHAKIQANFSWKTHGIRSKKYKLKYAQLGWTVKTTTFACGLTLLYGYPGILSYIMYLEEVLVGYYWICIHKMDKNAMRG